MQKIDSTEFIPNKVFKEDKEAIDFVADRIEEIIKSTTDRSPVICFSVEVGSLFPRLIEKHKEGLSFKTVKIVDLHEYYPINNQQQQSHHYIMHESLLDHIDVQPENILLLDGSNKEKDELRKYLTGFDEIIGKAGGIDLLVTSVGSSGRLGFNEPDDGSSNDFTIVAELNQKTRTAAASDFFSLEHVPHKGLTLGMGSILGSKEIIVMAFGEGKSRIVQTMVEGKQTNLPATSLQKHSKTLIVLDEAASDLLTRINTPWLVKSRSTLTTSVRFTEQMARKAVIWLSLKTNKPVLRLTEEDYNSNHLLQLLNEHGPTYDLNVKVFRHLRDTVTGWPGGKPSGKTVGKNNSFPKNILIFSPHPDDDVISMGGTLIRLAKQGHKVSVCYQTSGNIAVWDHDVLRHTYLVTEYAKAFGLDEKAIEKLAGIQKQVDEFVEGKKPAEIDSKEVQKIKGLIRRSEARTAAVCCGVKSDDVYFLDLPFYETGRVKKNPLGEADVNIVYDLIQKLKPQQIYAAGDLSDPHGTHRVCLAAVLQALKRCLNDEWFKSCEVWLYRGAWQEWEPERIRMAVPMSPTELMEKRYAIFKHQSQKDTAPFPGSDPREFWQRTEARNRETAKLYDRLGLAEYEAIEAFVMWDVEKDEILQD
eukprot:TRINITY_DN8401_c0_g1_i1.p1 TRINITY_DN8401_c0_g1~~TRINITY_DN8401_c0_g1_i1.p1  ORF type:complete len:645 (+),score=154.30 TRINITY_DN8401_c0_g1_i1:60-1994(+)